MQMRTRTVTTARDPTIVDRIQGPGYTSAGMRVLLAITIAASFAAHPVAATFHAVEHAHRYCEEHGVVEDAPASSPAPRAHAGTEPGAEETRSESAAHDGACVFANAAARELEVDPEPVSASALDSAEPPAELRSRQAFEPFAALERAPKASPPATA